MLDPACSLLSHTTYASGYGPGSEDMLRGWREYLPPGIDPSEPRISPLNVRDLGGAPPAFVLTAEYDTLRDEGEEYAHRLKEAGVPTRLKRFDGAIHGFFGMSGALRLAREAMRDCGLFLREHLLAA
jgi:acetyl esterase